MILLHMLMVHDLGNNVYILVWSYWTFWMNFYVKIIGPLYTILAREKLPFDLEMWICFERFFY